MKLLLLEPQSHELGLMFRDACVARFSANRSIDYYKQQYIAYYEEGFSSIHRLTIEVDIETIFEHIAVVIDDALDRLVPQAIKTLAETHVLWSPQACYTIDSIAKTSARMLGMEMYYIDVATGVGRLYCHAVRKTLTKHIAGTR